MGAGATVWLPALHRLEPVSHLRVPRLELDGVPGVVAHGAKEPSREDEHAPQVMAIELAQLGEELPIDRHRGDGSSGALAEGPLPGGVGSGREEQGGRGSVVVEGPSVRHLEAIGAPRAESVEMRREFTSRWRILEHCKTGGVVVSEDGAGCPSAVRLGTGAHVLRRYAKGGFWSRIALRQEGLAQPDYY